MAGFFHDPTAIKIANVLVYLLFLGSNIFAVIGPDSVYWGGKETYLTPARYVFTIWTVIHVLLFGTVIYQFFPQGQLVVVDTLGWSFAIIALVNTAFLHLWIERLDLFAFIAALVVSSLLTDIYYRIKQNHNPANVNDELWVHLPFSLWHGWSVFLIFLTGFQAFGVNAATHPPGILTKIFVFIALFLLESTSVAYAAYSVEGDLAASFAITWALFAIYSHQINYFIKYSALAFACLSLFSLVKALWGIYRTRQSLAGALHDEERRTLLPN